ncbi:hypothetical protein EV421DRAFT_1906485 [Armillaria borealis]|uniref:F-box domain-containing protein n=1 Tax=Armillaria borealis TaxID=47425 RepID=A0AA39J9C2_9AGAR|nr:hypothetical protein EV421DRAFT_1906485 [Armillaria borealis]
MSCLTCSNQCGFVNSPSPEPQSDTLKATQGSDSLVSQILRGSRPLLGSDHAPINDEIAKLEWLGSWHSVQLHAVLKSLENRKSLFAPVRRLPRDILLEIFHSVSDSWWQNDHRAEEDDRTYDRLDSTHDSLDMTGPLWVLDSVCGLWRDILYTSPASWARCVLVKSPFSKHARDILQAYLEHTGEHPLSLVALCDSRNLAEDGEIMSLLVQSCHRWRNVCIRIDIHHTHHLRSISHFPVLQTIEMYICDDYGYPSDMSLDMCLKASQLWQATLPNQGIHRVRLPSGITHYSGCITCAEDLQLLSQLSKLRTCHLRSRETSPTDAVPVVMAELRQLYVEDSDALDLLTAPMLQSLTIVEVSEGSLSSSSIAPFLRRSGCRLESLGMSAQGLAALISKIFSSEACSTISHLKLELGPNCNDISKILTPSSILPNLRHLVLCFACGSLLYKTKRLDLLNMIRSRCKAGVLKMTETSFERSISPTYIMEADIRAVIGDNVEMRVEEWSPLDLDYRYSFSGSELPQFW